MVGEVAMTVLKPSRPVNDPFIALETKLSKSVFPFQVALAATINIFPSIGDTDDVELKAFWLANPQQPSIREVRKERQSNRSISRATLKYRATAVLRPQAWMTGHPPIFFTQ